MFGLGQKVLSSVVWSKFWPILANQQTLTCFHENEAKSKKKFKKKIQNGRLKKTIFFKIANSQYFFASFPWKQVKVYWLARMGQNFDQAKRDNTFWPRPNILTGSVCRLRGSHLSSHLLLFLFFFYQLLYLWYWDLRTPFYHVWQFSHPRFDFSRKVRVTGSYPGNLLIYFFALTLGGCWFSCLLRILVASE